MWPGRLLKLPRRGTRRLAAPGLCDIRLPAAKRRLLPQAAWLERQARQAINVKFAAFFRNTNLGRAGSPDREQFEQAFLDAGASAAANFQVNGTLVFDTTSAASAQKVFRAATKILGAVAGLREPGCVRSLAALNRLPCKQVFAGVDPTTVHELTVSFACSRVGSALALPQSNERQDAVVLWLEHGNALSISRKVMSGPGSPNVLLERLTGVAFTSRSLGTIQRVLARHS